MFRRNQRVDEARVKQAVTTAGEATTGTIVVSVAGPFWGDPRTVAERTLARHQHSEGTILLLVCPTRRRFVVLGDERVHAEVGQAFWDEHAAALARRAADSLTDAIIESVAELAAVLARVLPRT